MNLRHDTAAAGRGYIPRRKRTPHFESFHAGTMDHDMDQLLGVKRSTTPVAVRKRKWRAAQSPEARERRRAQRQTTRNTEREREARQQRFQRLSVDDQEKRRRRDRQRHRILKRLRQMRKEIEQEIQDEEDAIDASAASDADSDVEAAADVDKGTVEVSDEVELSSDFIRACLNDRSDLFGPRPTVPRTKRAELLSYVVFNSQR